MLQHFQHSVSVDVHNLIMLTSLQHQASLLSWVLSLKVAHHCHTSVIFAVLSLFVLTALSTTSVSVKSTSTLPVARTGTSASTVVLLLSVKVHSSTAVTSSLLSLLRTVFVLSVVVHSNHAFVLNISASHPVLFPLVQMHSFTATVFAVVFFSRTRHNHSSNFLFLVVFLNHHFVYVPFSVVLFVIATLSLFHSLYSLFLY